MSKRVFTAGLTLGVIFGMISLAQEAGNVKAAKRANWNEVQAEMKKILSTKAKTDAKGVAFAGAEAPGSPIYVYITKSQAMQNTGHTKAQDQRALLMVPFSAPGNIIRVDFACTGPGDSCQHTYGCDAACTGHTNVWELNGKQGVFWGKTDDGNENLFTFAIHYQQ